MNKPEFGFLLVAAYPLTDNVDRDAKGKRIAEFETLLHVALERIIRLEFEVARRQANLLRPLRKPMKYIQLTPGAGGMYCGNCLRDNAMVAALGRLGHDVCMLPLYLPLTLDEEDQSGDAPIFFGGVSVYLEQKLPFFRFMPRAVHRWLASRRLLKTVGSRAAATHPSQVGELTVSMLRGEKGNQAPELRELCRWLIGECPEMVGFSNALLLGMHAEVKAGTGARTVCFISGEDGFLNELAEPFRAEAWNLVAHHAAEVDLLFAPSEYYARFMESRLKLPEGRIAVLPLGLNLDGYEGDVTPPTEPVLGYFARMTHGKGLDTLVDAFIEVRRRGNFPTLKLKVGGGFSPWNEPFLAEQEAKIVAAGLQNDVEYHPNLDRAQKIAFLKSLTLFSVPSRLNEPFGYFLLESHAAGIPGLFPNRAAFPEILAHTHGGLLFAPESPSSLADAIETLLTDTPLRHQLADNARTAVFAHHDISRLAARFVEYLA